MELDLRIAFAEGVLDLIEGEIPIELWQKAHYPKGVDEWRARCLAGLLANWKEFLEEDAPVSRLMRLYCLGVVRGMNRKVPKS